MKQIILLGFWALLAINGHAQTQFLQSGKIEFERKTNTHRLYLSDPQNNWEQELKKLIPQFKTDYFELLFTPKASLYRPGRESEDQSNGFFESPGSENVVYKNFETGTSVSNKKVFEAKYLLSDSIRQLEWKIESETRTIAGFECRKAVTRICDSVVVVAFYTDEIISSGGPESFGGLPGMILGIAIPRLYTTWFATRVELISDGEARKINPPSKGKKGTQKEVLDKVDDAISDWGEKYRNKAIWFLEI